MKTKSPPAIRISTTAEVRKALDKAKKLYPTLSDPEIFKLGLSKVVAENSSATSEEAREDLNEIRLMAANAFGHDYLNNPEEDIYTWGMGKKVNFT